MPVLYTLKVTILPDGRMNSANAARYLGLSTKTLAMMRCAGTGPPFIKRGHIFYYREDLDTWIAAAPRVSRTSDLTKRRKHHGLSAVPR